MSNNINNKSLSVYTATSKLTEEEINDPFLVIHNLFDFGDFSDIKKMFWEFFKATITGTYSKKLRRDERIDIVTLYEYLEKLIEAAHLINEKNKISKSLLEQTHPEV